VKSLSVIIPVKEDDSKIVVGSLITAYHKGYHRVINFKIESGYPLVYYKQEYTVNGKKKPGKTYQCHIDYCALVTEKSLREEIKKHQQVCNNLYDMLSYV
jgi:hypothetical protein